MMSKNDVIMNNRISTPLFSTRSSTPMNDTASKSFYRDDASISSYRRSDSALSMRRSESSLSRFPKVEANINRDDSLKIYRLRQRIQRDPHRAISIDDSPIMLLPKARVRNDYDVNFVKRAFAVVPQEDFTSLHLSTVPFAPPSGFTTPRSFSRLSFKSRPHSRSDADSGIGSMKRCVTFDELSIGISTVSKSLDDIERDSDIADFARGQDYDNDSVLEAVQSTFDSGVDVPDYIDNFAEDVFAVPIPPKIPKKIKKRECTLTEADIERCHEQNCEICRGFLNERQRIQRYFGGINSFLDWLYSKWGKAKRSGILSSSPVNRVGTRPRFCNIVKQAAIHEREKNEGYTDADYDYYRQYANGPLITRWRKHSHASNLQEHLVNQIVSDVKKKDTPSPTKDLDAGGTDGRPGSPSSHFGDGTEGVQRVNITAPSPVPENTGTIVPTIIDFPDNESKSDLHSETPQHLSLDIRVVITGKPVSESDKDKKILTPGSTRSFTEDAQNTPIQPPPTPEPVSPKEDKDLLQELSKTDDNNENIDAGKDVLAELEKETESKKRPPIQKKERKTGNRTRTKKPEMEVKEKPIGATPPTATPNTQDESKKKDIKVDLDLPSLPTVETDKKKKKEKKKVEKHLITQPKHEEVPKDPEELIDDQIKQRIKTYEMNLVDVGSDDTPRKTMAKPAWVTGRLALSQQSSRFELPMDIVRLETMSVLDYIKEFCIITRRRKKLYTDIFNKHKDPKPNVIPIKELEKAIKSVLVNTITSEHYKEIAQMLDINENTKIDLPTFSAISALCERLLCTSFMISRDQVDMPQKEDIECADFSALDWKLSGVQVKPQMYKLLKQLS